MSQYYDMISAHYIRDRDHLTNVVASLTWHTMTSWLRRPFMTGRSKTRSHRWGSSCVEPPFGFPGPSRFWLSSSTTFLSYSHFKHGSPMYHSLTKRIRLTKERGER